MLNYRYLLFSLVLASCSNDQDVKVYHLAKDSTESLTVPDAQTAELTWSAPAHWMELSPSGLRKGSFQVSGPDNLMLDISVVFLEGDVGGELANVNRWRSQIDLSPWSSEELSLQEKIVEISTGNIRVVAFNGEHSQGMMAAMLPYQHGYWFFKMTGDATLVSSQEEAFYTLLRSVRPKEVVR